MLYKINICITFAVYNYSLFFLVVEPMFAFVHTNVHVEFI